MRGARIRLALAAILCSLAVSVPLLQSVPAAAFFRTGPVDIPPTPELWASRLARADQVVLATSEELTQVQSRPQPEDFVSRLVLGYEVDSAGYRYRQAVRDQQRVIFNISAQPGLSDLVEQVAPPALAPVLHNAAGAYHAIWSLAGIDEYNLLRLHLHPLSGAEPVDTLRGFYMGAASQYQIDWSYLASINYIESDFGRVTGPSSAGALGPMQFMPSTWDAYGEGGDVNSPHDSIIAAARYLVLHGAWRNLDAAIFAYNHDWDYVAAVKFYANLIRQDPSWLGRLYYWSTAG